MARPRKNDQAEQLATYTVARRFQDAPEYRVDGVANIYEIGADVSHMDQSRLNTLVERGNVVMQGGEAPAPEASKPESSDPSETEE